MHPILIDLGFYALPSYGVILAMGVLLAAWTLKIRADRAGMEGERLVDLSLWLVIWALVGSKSLLIIVELPRYLARPGELLGVVRAGGVFLGGFIAALIAAFILLKRYQLKPLTTFDVMSPSLALGHAVGRIGCLMAGCCWGARCELPWAITYEDSRAHDLLGTPLHTHLHPFPIYASLFNLCLYFGLAALFRRHYRPGRVFATYLAVYGTARFLLEMIRGDASRGFVFHDLMSTSQLIGLLMVASGIVLHAWISSRSKP